MFPEWKLLILPITITLVYYSGYLNFFSSHFKFSGKLKCIEIFYKIIETHIFAGLQQAKIMKSNKNVFLYGVI